MDQSWGGPSDCGIPFVCVAVLFLNVEFSCFEKNEGLQGAHSEMRLESGVQTSAWRAPAWGASLLSREPGCGFPGWQAQTWCQP